jgi:hypothetical protein
MLIDHVGIATGIAFLESNVSVSVSIRNDPNVDPANPLSILHLL